MTDVRPLCVACIDGLDRRSLSPRDSPFLSHLLDTHPWTRIRTIPTNELLSTIYTGAYPRHHGKWQVTLRRDVPDRWPDRLLDHMPDLVTTTWQCLRHAWDKAYDIPGVPRRRRRRLDVHRFKYSRRVRREELLRPGGIPSIFQVLEGRCEYQFSKTFNRMAESVERLPAPGKVLSLLEVYAFDLFQHWHLDQPEAMRNKVAEVDRHLRALHQRCERQGVRFLLLSDHGQEPVHHFVNLPRMIRTAGVPRSDYMYYVEPAIARFWFRSDGARQRIKSLLRSVERTTLLTYRNLHRYNICFDDDRYGEVFLYSDHGVVFHPNDFVQPLANLFMALTEPTMRPRLLNPRIRGYHGHLPDHPAEEGFLVLADQGYSARGESIELIDLAPTMLDLVGEPAPDTMTGRTAFLAHRNLESSPVSRA